MIKSKRLKFRTFSPSDAPSIAALAGDWDIARMTARIPYPYTVAQAEHWVATLPECEFVRAVILDGHLIGAVGYYPCDDGSAEIGYWIGKPWWGQGYATEAANALVRHCFSKIRFGRLTCCHFVDNPASARVIAKLGFKEVGACKAYCEARRRDVETIRYELRRPALSMFWRRAA